MQMAWSLKTRKAPGKTRTSKKDITRKKLWGNEYKYAPPGTGRTVTKPRPVEPPRETRQPEYGPTQPPRPSASPISMHGPRLPHVVKYLAVREALISLAFHAGKPRDASLRYRIRNRRLKKKFEELRDDLELNDVSVNQAIARAKKLLPSAADVIERHIQREKAADVLANRIIKIQNRSPQTARQLGNLMNEIRAGTKSVTEAELETNRIIRDYRDAKTQEAKKIADAQKAVMREKNLMKKAEEKERVNEDDLKDLEQ